MEVAHANNGILKQIRIGDLRVNRIGLSLRNIRGLEELGQSKNDQFRIRNLLNKAINLGINFIDIEDSYIQGMYENLIAENLFPYKGLAIATKGSLSAGSGGLGTINNLAKLLRKSCENSLRRLRVDTLDLFQLPIVGPKVAFESAFQILLDLQREGKIKHIGLSNINSEHFVSAINMGRFVSVQSDYSLVSREKEELLKLCELHSIVFISQSPINSNSLIFDRNEIDSVAAKYIVSPKQIELAWLLSKSASILPLLSLDLIDLLEDSATGGAINLTKEEMEALDGLTNV